MNDIPLIAATILIPMIPAYILYKALPAQASVSGPLHGLNVQLSGAFAGYFVLVLTLIAFISSRPAPPGERYEVWEVKGRIDWGEGASSSGTQQVLLSLVPANLTVLYDGRFNIQVAPEVVASGKLKFPTLVIEHPDFQTISIDLNDPKSGFGQPVENVSVDAGARAVAVVDPIKLKKKISLPPYNPAAASPQQAALKTQEAAQ